MLRGKSALITTHGPWALVTGASSGIGTEFARQLAGKGFHLVLVARRLELLETLAKELTSAHQIEVRCLKIDLSDADAAGQIIQACEELEIGLIVNNAGSGVPGDFSESDPLEEKKLLHLNCLTPMALTRGLLPGLLARNKGGVIFVSSLMGFQGVPYMANYSATKGFLLNLGEALHHELRDKGIDVLVLAPGATNTPGKDLHPVDYSKLPIQWMSPERVVEAALKGLARRKTLVIPGWKNHLTGCVGGGLWSRRIVQRIMARLARNALPLKDSSKQSLE